MPTKTLTNTILFEVFVFLQLLDFLTTLMGIKFGAQEANPFVRYLMNVGTIEGLIYCKLLMLAGALWIMWSRRLRVISALNYLFAALVVWNLTQLMKLPVNLVS